MTISFTAKAERQLKNLPHDIQRRIARKMRFFAEQKNPLHFAKILSDPRLGEYRFRIGDYRVAFDVSGNAIIVVTVKHRREAYDL